MKKLLVLLCALFLVQGATAQVWLPVNSDLLNLASFRMQSTGGTIEDDLDNAIDGTDIFAVDGARIYTNLSNLVTGGEHQGDNMYSDNMLLIGATSPIYKGYKLTAFYGKAKQSSSKDFLSDEIYRQDINSDQVFDSTALNHLDSNAVYDFSQNSLVLNLGKKMGEETEIAFTYIRSGSTTKNDRADSTYYTRMNISPAVTSVLRYGSGYDNSESTFPITTYALSYCKPFRDWKLRGDAFLVTGGINSSTESLNHSFIDGYPRASDTTYTYNSTRTITGEDGFTANLAGVSLLLSDENKQTGLLWEVGGNFGMIFGSGDNDYVEEFNYLEREELSPPEIRVLDSTYTDSTNGNISVSGTGMGANGRIEWQISDNVVFGLGCMYNSYSMTLEEDRNVRTDIVSDFDDGDTQGSDPDDYTITVNGNDRDETVTTEIKINRIAIPAGVELNFGKNKDWYMRLGAVAVGSRTEITDETVVDSLYIGSSVTARGDGSSSTSYLTSSTLADNETNTSSSTYQYVDYVYGLGWKPSPNLSLDLIGMFDFSGVELLSTDWLQSLRLSATLNIY